MEVAIKDIVKKTEAGVFKSDVLFFDKVFLLTDVGKAHEYMEEPKAVGSVV